MATYALLMLLTPAVSFFAVMVYRRINNLRDSTAHAISLSEDSLVSLSKGSGQWSIGLQQGFVRTKKRTARRRVKSTVNQAGKVSRKSEGSNRRPWGW